MKRAIRSAAELRRQLQLPLEPIPEPSARPTAGQPVAGDRLWAREPDFPTFVPLEFLRRIEIGNPDDPLLRQVLDVPAERESEPGFVADPVGDLEALSAPGLIHKYHGRALIVSTGACGVHCRYCFRREFPYSQTGSTAQSWKPAIDYLGQRSEIEEVLLSGGDPLTLVDEKLFALIEQLESVPHLRRLRIHSRMPVVIPQRLTPELVARLRQSRLTTWMVIHANHPRELDQQVLDHLSMLLDAGIPVLNQAVLLQGVNDHAETLIDLSRVLVDHRIQPYYLHQLDRVRGAAHFEVPIERGLQLVEAMRAVLPGYAVPTYVREEAGRDGKTPLIAKSTAEPACI